MTLARDEYFDTYAISTRLFLQSPLEYALRRIASVGFRWVELWSDGCHVDPRQSLDVPAVARLMRELGVGAHSVHTPFGGLELGHPVRCDGPASRRLIIAAIERAAELGARVAVVHPNSYEGALDPSLHSASRDEARAIIYAALEAAERCGLRVALENMVAVGYWRFGTSVTELAGAFGDQRIGLCLDVGHARVQGLDLAHEIEVAGPRLVSLHVHDNDGTRDEHLPPLRGSIDWGALDGALTRAGYRGRRVLEVGYREGEEEILLAEAASLWQRWPAPLGSV